MKLKILIIIMFCLSGLLIFSQPVLCQQEKTKKNSEVDSLLSKRCSEFFEQIISSKVQEAYDFILSKSPIMKNTDQIKNLVDQTIKANEMYGNMKSYQLVNVDKATHSLIRIRFLSLHSDYPMRWIFTFYKSPTLDWIIINIKFDDLAENFFGD
jgi:hypothetical protein